VGFDASRGSPLRLQKNDHWKWKLTQK